MSFKISSDVRGSRGPGPWCSEAVFCLLIVALAVTAACSAPASSEPEAAVRLAEPSESVAAEPAPDVESGGQGLVDSEELIGLGELGLLPSLLQSFGAGIDCDFDDAFSTCQ